MFAHVKVNSHYTILTTHSNSLEGFRALKSHSPMVSARPAKFQNYGARTANRFSPFYNLSTATSIPIMVPTSTLKTSTMTSSLGRPSQRYPPLQQTKTIIPTCHRTTANTFQFQPAASNHWKNTSRELVARLR